MHDGAGERSGDAGYTLDLGDDEAAKVVHVVGLGPDDHVIGSRDVVGLGHAGDLADAEGHVGCLPDLGLDENVCLHHEVLHGGGCHGKRYSRAFAGGPAAGQDPAGFPPAKNWAVRQEDVITVAELGEFGLIAAIRELLPAADAILVGAGDDAAVVAAPDGRVVASTDLLVEGRHFRRDWAGPVDVGAKAAAQNLADIAAMGAVPTALLAGVAVPGDLSAEWVLDLIRGMVAECARAGAAVAGGDISSADEVMLGITALGSLGARPPVTRSGAKPGDLVAVNGRVGWAAAGLALLQAGLSGADLGTELGELVAAHVRPRPDYRAGPEAAMAGATAMIDVSDGLVADLRHIATGSRVCVDVQSASLAASPAVTAAARLLGVDWLDWALAGGEDHALAATFPPKTMLPDGWVVVGTVREGAGVLVDSAARRAAAGWDHFR